MSNCVKFKHLIIVGTIVFANPFASAENDTPVSVSATSSAAPIKTTTTTATVTTTASIPKPTTHSVHQQINQLIQKKLSSANVGYILMDATNGKIITQYNANKLFAPASNTKNFVSVAALLHFPADFTYITTLTSAKKNTFKNRIQGDVVFRFAGDPSLSSDDIDTMFAQMKTLGITTIKGDVIIDASIFSPPRLPDGYSLDDIAWYYAAPVDGIMVDGNQVKLKITAGEKVGDPIIVTAYPHDAWVKIQSDVKSVGMDYVKKHCDLSVKVDQQNQIALTGCWPIERKQADQGIALANPYQRAKEVISAALTKHNIRLRGKITVGIVEEQPDDILLASHQSAPMPTLIKTLLKDSNNLYADAIFKTLGHRLAQKGSFVEGINAVTEILTKNTNVKMKKIVISDGSGSRYNLVSPSALADLLYFAFHHNKVRQPFLNSLPIAGRDGTLAWRYEQVKLPGKLIAKTGTMKDISSLSGYFWAANGKPYIFSIMINNVLGDINAAKRVEEQLTLLMFEMVA